MVLHEEQHQTYGCSGSVPAWEGVGVVLPSAAAATSAGGEHGEDRPNKKPKQKKTPQRGLGVAQLEKIRLEEQQKGAATTSAASLPASFSSVMALPPMPPSSNPFQGASERNPATEAPSIAIPAAPFCDLLVPMPPPPIDGSMVAPHASLAGHGCFPLLWNPLEISPHDVEASTKMFSFPLALQDDPSSTIWPPPCPVQSRRQQQQQPKHLLPNSSVNPSFYPSLCGANLRMEPPSNQTNMSNSGSPLWPADEKIAGMKRSWPFHVDATPGYTSFPCRLPLPPIPFPLADELPSMKARDLQEFKPESTNLRDGTPCAGTFQVDWRSLCGHLPDKKCKERSYAPLHGDILSWGSSLPPPAPAAAPKSRQQTGTLLSHSHEPSSVSAPVPYHANTDGAILRSRVSSESSDEVPFYSFLPMRPSSQESTSKEQRHEALEALDLNLKL